MKERNSRIVKAYVEGYSQHMIAKVLGIFHPAVKGLFVGVDRLSLSPDPEF